MPSSTPLSSPEQTRSTVLFTNSSATISSMLETSFFQNYEGTRIRQGRTSNVNVPSDAFRRGDFSSLSTPIKDPLTGVPFPGNIIPANRINPATAYFLQFMPQQNTGAGTFVYAAPF